MAYRLAASNASVSTRAFSSLQRSRTTLLRSSNIPALRTGGTGLAVASLSRSYFWSSKPKPPVDAATSPPLDVEPVTTAEASSALSSSSPPVEVASTTIPAEAAAVASDASSAATALVDPALSIGNAVVAAGPLQYGDLHALGLTSWWPAGWINWSMEIINTTTGLPWFWTIVAGTVFWRVVLIPFTIEGLRNSARLQPLQPQTAALREEMKAARLSTDAMALQKVALKNKKLYADAGVNMGSMMLMPFIQLPVNLGIFFGVKSMCNLPVPQLKESGFEWLPDLTVPDPTYIIPATAIAMMNLQIFLSARDMNLAERPETGHIMNLFRVLTLAGAWVMSAFPSGLMLSLLVGSTFTVAQTAILRMPAVRTRLRIPVVPKEHQSKLPSFLDSINFVRQWYRESVQLAHHKATQERQRIARRRK